MNGRDGGPDSSVVKKDNKARQTSLVSWRNGKGDTQLDISQT